MLYIEGAAGISGDMTVGALLSLGASADRLAKALDSMRLGDGGGIALEIDPALAAVYRFLPPVDETYAVSAELSATGRTDLRLKVRLNGREIATLAAAKGGKASLAPVQVCARRLDRIDFAVEGGDALAAGELVPRVSFAREARR